MGDLSMSKLEKMLTCPVCQDIFTEPGQLPCGHSMCTSCIKSLADHSSGPFTPFRCPDCRGFFGTVIGVHKSYTLCSIVEEFKMNRKREDQGIKSVFCSFCTDQTPAKKTCLKCEVSMCKEHVKEHQELRAFTGHPLVKPLSDLQQRKCPQHEDQVLKYYCNASKGYICNLCALESKQQNQISETSTVLRRQLTETMRQHFKDHEGKIQDCNESVKKILRNINKKKKEPEQSPFNTLSVALLVLLAAVAFNAYSYSVENQALTGSLYRQQIRLHDVYSSINDFLLEKPERSQTHADTEDEGALLLDLDTASPYIGLSVDQRTAERVKTKLDYLYKTNRFNEAPQILSTRCFAAGSHTWEVEAEGFWDIAVAFKSIKRKSKRTSTFGNNAESWSLTHNSEGKLYVTHRGEKTVLSASLQSSRIAVSVDMKKGSIKFSAVNATVQHLHQFNARLTEPVCLGFGLYRADPPSRASIVRVS